MLCNLTWVVLISHSYYYFTPPKKLQLKKMNNSKPAPETSEPSETVEQGSMTNESGSGENTEELMDGTTTENKVLKNGSIENGKKETLAFSKNRKKRKFPSREVISKER